MTANESTGRRRTILGRGLADDLRRRIRAGEFAPGEKLPSESRLGATYGVSRVTVRTALQLLESRGLVDIRHGSGSFVTTAAATGIRAGLQELLSMSETIRELGYTPSMQRRALDRRPATADEAARLRIAAGDEVWSLDRAVRADDHVVAYSHDLIPVALLADGPADGASGGIADRASGGTAADGPAGVDGVDEHAARPVLSDEAIEERFGTSSVFDELSRRGLEIVRAVAELHVVSAVEMTVEPDEQHSLYLLLDQLHETSAGEAVLYSRTYFVEGRFQFVILRTR